MSNHRHTGSQMLLAVLKALLIGTLKIIALALAFVFKLSALILDKLATVLQTFAGYGKAH